MAIRIDVEEGEDVGQMLQWRRAVGCARADIELEMT